MSGVDLPTDSVAVLDSSVLFAMGGPANDNYQAFETYVTRRNIACFIPDHVAEELGESPESYQFQRDRLSAAQAAGWLERTDVAFSNSGVSTAIDRTRERIHALSDDDVTEDEIETTDGVLAGLAYQYSTEQSSHVAVLVSDTLAEQAINDVLTALGAGDETTVVDGRSFLAGLLNSTFD